MVAHPRPFEISSGEPFADVASTTPPNLAALVSEAWRAAGDALSRDPALALAPLRFLRGHRFAPPRWPPDAAPTLVSALDKAEECARASPSLANELWDTAATLLATWARWRSADHPANVPDVRATLARVLAVVRDRALDAHRHRRARPHHPRAEHPRDRADPAAAEPNPASELPSKLGPTPALVLACVAAAPPCDTQLRLDALRALVRLAGSDSSARATTTTFSGPSSSPANARGVRSLGDAQTLAAAFAYALSASEALDARAGVDGVVARARDVTLAFARSCRAVGPADALFAQRVGATLIAGCKTLNPKLHCPRAAAAAAATARDALASSADGASADAAGFAFVAGALAAEDAMRTAVGMTIRITADETLPDRVASAWTWSGLVGDRDGSSVALRDEGLGPGPGPGPGPGLGFGFGPGDGPRSPAVDVTLNINPPPARAADDDVSRFCAVAAFAVSARACLADRAYSTDAAFADASIRAACACLRAPFAFLASLEDARAEPSAAAALVRLTTLAPSASLAPSLLTLVATRLNESPTLRVLAASTAFAFVSRFARSFHESYRGFKRRADPRRIAAMDPDAIRPAFLGVFRATIGFAHVAPMTTARDVVAAAEAAAAVEFARAPDPRYAPALQRIAAAMSADHPVARAARLAFVAEAFPDERELDAPVTGTTMETGTTTGMGSGRVDEASKNTVGVAWRDDDVFGTRLHLLLRLLPFAAPGPIPFGGGGGGDRPEDEPSRRRFASVSGSEFASCSLSRAMPTALRCVGHPRAAIARAAHVAHVGAFRTHPETHEVWFLPYLDAALERFPGSTPGEPFVAAVGTVAQRGSPGSRLAVEAARRVVRRAEALDALASVAGSNPDPGAGGAAAASAASVSAQARERARAAAATLRRLVFGLVALVDHELVPELRDACEAAVLGAGARGFESRSGRFAAYEDLVDGVLAIGDYARKSDAVRWALRLRSRI